MDISGGRGRGGKNRIWNLNRTKISDAFQNHLPRASIATILTSSFRKGTYRQLLLSKIFSKNRHWKIRSSEMVSLMANSWLLQKVIKNTQPGSLTCLRGEGGRSGSLYMLWVVRVGYGQDVVYNRRWHLFLLLKKNLARSNLSYDLSNLFDHRW